MGIDGLTYRPKLGRPRRVSKQTVAEVIAPVLEEPSSVDEAHWTITKLVGGLKENKKLSIAYSPLVRHVHEQEYKFKRLRPDPEPPNREVWDAQRERFAEALADLMDDDPCDLFFGDEAGFEGDPRPRRRRPKRGQRIMQGISVSTSVKT